MNVTSIAQASLADAFDRLGGAATKIAAASDPANPGDLMDFSEAAIELSLAKIEAAASVKLIRAENEITKQTLDMLA